MSYIYIVYMQYIERIREKKKVKVSRRERIFVRKHTA